MLDLLSDLWGFMRERKKFLLAPIIFVQIILGALILFAQGSAIAPFIYTLYLGELTSFGIPRRKRYSPEYLVDFDAVLFN